MKLLLCCVLFLLLHWLRPTEQRAQKMQISSWITLCFGLWFIHIVDQLLVFTQSVQSDFAEYCVGVVEMERGWFDNDIPPKRTRLAALLPTIGAQITSVINGFALSSILSTVLIFLLVYMWGARSGALALVYFQLGYSR